MKFLADQDVYAAKVRCLNDMGHDVAVAVDKGLSHADDADLLLAAQKDGRILLTRDRDFGWLVFSKKRKAGVVYLRIFPSTQDAVHSELKRVLTTHQEGELSKAFVVVEPARHRIRNM